MFNVEENDLIGRLLCRFDGLDGCGGLFGGLGRLGGGTFFGWCFWHVCLGLVWRLGDQPVGIAKRCDEAIMTTSGLLGWVYLGRSQIRSWQ